MNIALTTQDDFNLDAAIKDLDSMKHLCNKLLQTKHYQAMGEVGIFAIIQKAKSLGMNPIEALSGSLYFVNGKVGMSTETMNALIRKAGHSITKDAKSNNSICILHGRRGDNGDTWTCTFSIEDAKRAGLLKNMYEKYPQIMIFNRCMSMLARQLFPDVIKGAGYTLDELQEINPRTVMDKSPETKFEYIEEKISEEQAHHFITMIASLDPDTMDKFMKFIKNPPMSAEKIQDIPLSQYENLNKLLTHRYEEAMKKKEPIEQDVSFNPDEFEKEAS